MRATVRIDDDLMIELKARAHDESISLTRVLSGSQAVHRQVTALNLLQ